MSGQDGGRGYLVQALISVLNALQENNWNKIEIEPNQADNKVDVRWTLTNGNVKVTQVKSSINTINISDASKWLEDLLNGTPNAQYYELVLLGGHSQGVVDIAKALENIKTKAAEDIKSNLSSLIINNFDKINLKIFPLDLDNLKDIATVRLEKFLETSGSDIPSLNSKHLIIDGLVTNFFINSTKGTPFVKSELEKLIKSWVNDCLKPRKISLAILPPRKYIQIAGSANKNTQLDILIYSHKLVCDLTYKLLENNYGLIAKIGEDLVIDPSNPTKESRLLYHWDILETIDLFLTYSSSNYSNSLPLAKIISSEKEKSKIPSDQLSLWKRLEEKKVLECKLINPGWNAGAHKRTLEAETGDALVILGGGEGVEHLAQLYIEQKKPVIPLDLKIQSMHEDGDGGAERLFRYACYNPRKYIGNVENTSTHFNSISTNQGTEPLDKICANILRLLQDTIKLRVIYIRSIDKHESDFSDVENFFQNIITPFINSLGYSESNIEIDTICKEDLNLQTLEKIYYSSLIITDLTCLSKSQLIALGFALGNKKRVILTYYVKSKQPSYFSVKPCFYWNNEDKDIIDRFCKFWKDNYDKKEIISSTSLL